MDVTLVKAVVIQNVSDIMAAKVEEQTTIITTDECEQCIYCTLDESDKSKIIIKCSMKEREYIWGRCIPCNFRKVRKNDYA